jgi:hypothetical protein
MTIFLIWIAPAALLGVVLIPLALIGRFRR